MMPDIEASEQKLRAGYEVAHRAKGKGYEQWLVPVLQALILPFTKSFTAIVPGSS